MVRFTTTTTGDDDDDDGNKRKVTTSCCVREAQWDRHWRDNRGGSATREGGVDNGRDYG
jgi:hypothetical protein